MTLQQRLEALATAVRDKINAMMPRLQPSGGTVGQVLAKNSATFYDSSWTSLTKSSVGLANVDNTADSVKAVFTATKLATPRTINGVSFDGSANITINAVDSTPRLAASAVSTYGLSLIDDADAVTARTTLGLGSLATQSDVTYAQAIAALGFTPYNSTNPSGYITGINSGMVTTALGYTPTSITGYTGAQTPAAIKTALALVKADVGLGSVDNTADATKNVLSATKLTTPRTINGVSFDGSANITIPVSDTDDVKLTGDQSVAGVKTFTNGLTVSAAQQLTFNGSGTAKARIGGLPAVADWIGVFNNASFNGSGWVLDDTTKYGAFYKIDVRAGSPSIAFWKIPTGAGTHTDESQMLGMDLATGNVTINYNLTVNGTISGSGTGITGLTKTQVGLSNVENKSSATIRSELTSANVTGALGYTPSSFDGVFSSLTGRPTTLAGYGITDSLSATDTDITVSNYVSMTSGAGYTASASGNGTSLSIAISTGGRASSASAKSGDFVAEVSIPTAPYDFFMWVAATQATANVPAGAVAGIEAYDGYFYDLSGTGAFKPFDQGTKLFFYRHGTTVDIYAGPTFQTAVWRHSMTCPAGALYLNFSTNGYAGYNGAGTVTLYDVVIPTVFNRLAFGPNTSIGYQLERKAGLEYPTLTTGLSVIQSGTPTESFFVSRPSGTTPFRLRVTSPTKGSWDIGTITANNRVQLATPTYSGNSLGGFEFTTVPYVGTNVMYHAGNLDKSTIGLGSVDNTADATKNVLSATKLTTPRTINGVSFDGSANITISASGTGIALDGETYSTSAAHTAGTNAQGQGAITTDNVYITTTPNTPSGVTLPAATAGRRVTIINAGTQPVNVYPASGGQIDAKNTNGALGIPVGGKVQFDAISTTLWRSDLVVAYPQASGVSFFSQTTPTAKSTTGTLSASDVLSLLIVTSGTTAISLTLPTGAIMDGNLLAGTLATDMAFEWYLINTGTASGAVTILAGTNHTIVGNAVVAIGTSARFYTRKTGASTFITYRIG